MNDDLLDDIIKGVYSGKIGINDLPLALYQEITSLLTDALVDGFIDVVSAGEAALFESLFYNIQMFSGAKTANMILDFEAMLIEDGKIVEFSVFKEKVLSKYNNYMTSWMETEYNYVVESSKAAKRWVRIWNERGNLDLLEYVTVGDSLVRDSHKILDGIVKKVDDPFWNTYYPPWEWNCRCTTKSYSSEDIDPTKWE